MMLEKEGTLTEQLMQKVHRSQIVKGLAKVVTIKEAREIVASMGRADLMELCDNASKFNQKEIQFQRN